MRAIEAIAVADTLIPMSDVLDQLGIWYTSVPGSLRCPIHGGGREKKPSARIYADNKTIHCFACGHPWSVSEVAGTVWSMKRGEAAQKLLESRGFGEKEIATAIREAQTPKKSTAIDSTRESIERNLRSHKGIADFLVYREWAKKSDEQVPLIAALPESERRIALRLFLNNMEQAL